MASDNGFELSHGVLLADILRRATGKMDIRAAVSGKNGRIIKPPLPEVDNCDMIFL